MFRECLNLSTIPSGLLNVSAFDVPVESGDHFNYMFYGCTSLTSVPANLITNVPYLGIATCSYMFGGCTALQNTVNISHIPFSTYAFGACQGMYMQCEALTTLPNTAIPDSKPSLEPELGGMYEMAGMFSNAINLVNIGSNHTSAWFAARRTQDGMFYNCTKITSPIAYVDIPTGWK
jgi:hypothetical protein